MQSAIDPYLIKVDGLSKAFAGVLALDAVSLRIRENLLYAVAGPQGAGKTTLINILATGLRPDSGTVVVAGHDVVSDVLRVRRRVGLVTSDASLDDGRTVAENLMAHGSLCGMPPSALRRAIPEVLAQLGLIEDERRIAGALPAPARARLKIARALLHDPEVLLLDEPTATLDGRARAELWRCLGELRARRWLTIVVATSDPAEIEHCQMALLLDHGRTIASGTPDKLRQHHAAELNRLSSAARAVSAG